MLPPSSRWRPCTAERFAGSNGRPASTPMGTLDHGGLAVVRPTSPTAVPVFSDICRTEGSWHIRPWQGPMVTVV